jgi:hypothetical protein
LGGADFRGLTFRALLQVRYTSSFAERSQNERVSYRVREEHLAEQGDGWDIGRVFLRASARPAPWVGLKTVFDFGELAHGNTKSTVKQAYVTLEPWAGHVEILTGIFKLPFSILELDPSSKYEFVNNGPINELTGELGFAGRDLGAEVVVAPLRKPKQLKLVFGAFRGHAKDEQDSPLGAVAGRIETRALKGFRFGAGWVEHPRRLVYRRPLETSSKDELPNPPDPLYPRQKTWGAGRALGGDVTFQRWKLNLRAEGLYGDRVDVDQRYHARKFAGGWAIAAYRFRVGGVKQMPALRFELLDADLDRARGLRRELAAAWNVLLSDQLRLVVDVTRTDVDRDSPLLEQPLPLQDPPYFELDRTRVGAQLQLDL